MIVGAGDDWSQCPCLLEVGLCKSVLISLYNTEKRKKEEKTNQKTPLDQVNIKTFDSLKELIVLIYTDEVTSFERCLNKGVTQVCIEPLIPLLRQNFDSKFYNGELFFPVSPVSPFFSCFSLIFACFQGFPNRHKDSHEMGRSMMLK